MVNELISVIMPAHNGGTTIRDSIESVIAQTYSQWELIIVDDCSTDNTREIVEEYQGESRIRCSKQNENLGVAATRNKGIGMAKGRYIAFLDCDDLWLPEKLEHQLFFMRRNHYGFTCTEYRQFTDDPQNVGNIIKVQDSIDYWNLLKGNDIGCLTVMLDREIYLDVKMPAQRHEDYITWLNLLRAGGKVYGLHEDLARYRKSSQSLTGNKWQSLRWTWNVYRKSQKLAYHTALKNMCYYIFKGLKKHY